MSECADPKNPIRPVTRVNPDRRRRGSSLRVSDFRRPAFIPFNELIKWKKSRTKSGVNAAIKPHRPDYGERKPWHIRGMFGTNDFAFI
jgi:hypothetical protein